MLGGILESLTDYTQNAHCKVFPCSRPVAVESQETFYESRDTAGSRRRKPEVFPGISDASACG